MPSKVAINGLGRIGRAALKLALEQPELELVAVNEIGSLDNMVYLLKYDTVYGRYERQVEAVDGKLVIDGKPLVYLSERDPERLPWADLEVDLVLECTGRFTEREDAEKHVRAGARWVVLSGPTKSPDVPTIVHGVNRPDGESQIISCASCTTNNITPLVEILDRHFGVDKALLTTVHAYTATQALVDSPGGAKDLRRGRAAAQNFVPSSTGAATATAKALPAMAGRFDGSRSAARWSSAPSRTSSWWSSARPRSTRSTRCWARRRRPTATRVCSAWPRSRWSRPTSSRTPAPPSCSSI
jgi:glyceraldehyde 3-phosphate dehydrogenase